MKKLIIATAVLASLLAGVAQAGYYVPTCAWVWNGFAWVWVCG